MILRFSTSDNHTSSRDNLSRTVPQFADSRQIQKNILSADNFLFHRTVAPTLTAFLKTTYNKVAGQLLSRSTVAQRLTAAQNILRQILHYFLARFIERTCAHIPHQSMREERASRSSKTRAKKFLMPIVLLVATFFMTSCASWVKIANLTIASTRNFESKAEYKELQRFAEGFDNGKTITASGGNIYVKNNGRITAAIEDAIRNVPGGEFMKNVEVFEKDGRIKVRGDVWGLPENANKNQFGHNINIGDKVMFKQFGNFIKGIVITTEVEQAAVKYNDDRGQEQIKKIDYDKLTKYNETDTQIKSSPNEFSIGDIVSWKKTFGSDYEKGEVFGFKGEYVLVKYTNSQGDEKTKELTKDKLIKVEKNNVPVNKTQPKPTNTNPVKEIYKTTTDVNMRSGAGSNFSLVMKISKGAQVEVLKKDNPNWWQIQFNDEIGFVSSKFLIK